MVFYIKNKTGIALITLTVVIFSLFPQNGFCITIKEEKEMSREFILAISQQLDIIDDPIISNYINKIGKKILAALPQQVFNYHFYVIKEDAFNAFASPAGHIFVNSGLFAALDTEAELAGIIGHEIAHVVCRHISNRIEASKKIGAATLAGMIAGVLLGVGGASAAANAVTMGSIAAGQTAALSFSRQNEMQADQIGLAFINDAGYSAEGLLNALKIIRSRQWYGSGQVPSYLSTHPASEERMGYIDTWIQHEEKERLQITPETGIFPIAHTRVKALYTDAEGAMAGFKSAMDKNPTDAMARYGYGLVLSRTGDRNNAISHMKKALSIDPRATYIFMDLGKVYFQEGRYREALQALSNRPTMDNPERLFFLGRTNVELGDLEKAKTAFETLLQDHKFYTKAYYFLGEVNGKLGDLFNAHYNLGLFYIQKKHYRNAVFHLERAVKEATTPQQKKRAEKMLKKIKPRDRKRN